DPHPADTSYLRHTARITNRQPLRQDDFKVSNSIVNKTPLSLRAAQALTGAPGTYLDSLAAASDMRREWFDDVIATHLIDPYFLRNNDYEAFYTARAKQLEDMVYAAMGKRTILRDMTDGKAVQ
ncbi:hypothetical protein ACIBB3_36330, partial [Streptomyces sp. NPDC051546]